MNKQILKNQTILDEKLNALLDLQGADLNEFKTVNPTIKPPKPPTGG